LEAGVTLSEALKVPGVWWLVLRGHYYGPDQTPAKVEVIKVLTKEGQSIIRIDDKTDTMRVGYDFDGWDAYDNFWLAWAAIQRSKA
jgi:hypothetical protein